MIHKQLTTETWSEDHPRAKHQVGDKIVYYVVADQSSPGPLKHEMDMMQAAIAAGVPAPRVHSYSRHDELEICVMDYVEGTPLEKLAQTDPAGAETIAAKVRSCCTQLETATTPQPRLPPNHAWMGGPYPSSRALYESLIRTVMAAPIARPRWELDPALFTFNAARLATHFPDEHSVLTHADLKEHNNVIVHNPDAADSGFTFIDWELAGYYPLHVARWLSGTLDIARPLDRAVDALCSAQKAMVFGDPDLFASTFPKLLKSLEALGATTVAK